MIREEFSYPTLATDKLAGDLWILAPAVQDYVPFSMLLLLTNSSERTFEILKLRSKNSITDRIITEVSESDTNHQIYFRCLWQLFRHYPSLFVL